MAELTGVTLTLGQQIEQQQKLSSGSAIDPKWKSRFAQSFLQKRYVSESPVLGAELEKRFESLSKSIQAVQWPSQGSPTLGGRLVVSKAVDDGKVSATLPEQEDAVRYFRKFSRGHDPAAAVSLEEGTYKFTLGLGDETDDLSVDVESGWTYADLYNAFVGAVNDSKLGVRASQFDQTLAEQDQKGLFATGRSISLSVNAARGDLSLSLDDTSGHLLDALDFDDTKVPLRSATEREYLLSDAVRGKATVFSSELFDPNAETTLNPGTHSMDWAYGPHSGSIEFDVWEGAEWRDVLNSAVNAINGSQSYFTAETFATQRISDRVADDQIMTDVMGLRVEAINPKLGERLAFTGGSHLGTGTFEVATSESGRLEASVDETQYGALNTGTKVSLSSDGTLPAPLSSSADYYVIKVDQAESPGYKVLFAASLADAEAGTAITLTDSGTGEHSISADEDVSALEVLGLNSTAWPGRDGELAVNADRMAVEPNGVFSVDEGRLELDVEEGFVGHLPLSVVEPMARMEDQLSDVFVEYNSLRNLILANERILLEGLADEWKAPLDSSQLEWAGVRQSGPKQTAWLMHDEFYTALGADPDTVQDSLLGENGLLPTWESMAERSLKAGGSSFLVPETSITDTLYGPPKIMTELELEKNARLVDMMSGGALPEFGGIVSRKG